MAIAMCVGCADCSTFTGLPVLHRLAEKARIDDSKVVTYNKERFLPLCRDCDAYETLMSLVTDLTERVDQLDNQYLQQVEDRARQRNTQQEDEPTPDAWREPYTTANRRRLMALDELTAELIRDRIRKRRQAAESGGTMMPGWKQYGVHLQKSEKSSSGSSSTNQPQKRKIDVAEPMTQTTHNCSDAAQSKARPATPAVSQIQHDHPPAQAEAAPDFIEVRDEEKAEKAQQLDQHQKAPEEAEDAKTQDPAAQQHPHQPSPATTMSANLSATEDSSTIQYEPQVSMEEPTQAEKWQERVGQQQQQRQQPAEEPTEEYSPHTPPQVDTPHDESPDGITLAMIGADWTSHTIPPSFEERQQWLAAGWVDPDDWRITPTDDQVAAWRRNGWLTQRDIEERAAWAAAGWRFNE